MPWPNFPPSGYGMPTYGGAGASQPAYPRPPAAGYAGAAGYPNPSTGYPIWGRPQPGANVAYARPQPWTPTPAAGADALAQPRTPWMAVEPRRRRKPEKTTGFSIQRNAYMSEPQVPLPAPQVMY